MGAYLPLLPLVNQKKATVSPKTFPFSVASIFLYHKNLGEGIHVSLSINYCPYSGCLCFCIIPPFQVYMIKCDFIAFAACNINSMSISVTICLLFTCTVLTFFVFWNFPATQLRVGANLQPYRMDSGHRGDYC
jgi:hypothetical protein